MNRLLWILLLISLSRHQLSAQNLVDTKVSVSFKNYSIHHCIKTIERVSGLSFSYNLNAIRHESATVTASFEQETVGAVLDEIFKNTALEYKEIAGQVTIYVNINKRNAVSLSGYIVDKSSREKIVGARLYFPDIKTGCVSNPYGFYHINLTKGEFDIIISSVGMQTITRQISIENNIMLNFELEEGNVMLSTIDVTASQDSLQPYIDNIPSLEKIAVESQALLRTPSSNGLPDISKYIQNLPGVQPLFDGSSSYMVRGLPNGNNLILLDEIPIYHPNHLLGIYSIINTNAIRSANLYKDYIPAKFGLRNSSVLQIYTKEGNLNKFHIEGGIGASVPNISIEGPIIKNKASFYASGRRSAGVLNTIGFLPATNLPNPDFYDLTFKANYKVNYQNNIYLTAYIGQDQIIDTARTYKWGNDAFSFRWNRTKSDNTFTNLTLISSIFNYKANDANNPANDVEFGQNVISSQVKYDVTYFASNRNKIKYGVSALNTRTQNNEDQKDLLLLRRNNYETSVYGTIERQVNSKLKIDLGLRIPFTFHIGTQDTSLYLLPDQTFEQVIYQNKRPYDFKLSFDPRFLATYRLNANNSLQWSEIVSTQFIHIVNFNSNILPVQVWTTPSKYLKPERNYQSALALIHYEKDWQASATVFHRFVNHIIDFAPSTYSSLSRFESNLLSGWLNAAGVELMWRYERDMWYSAQVSYTYTYARQKTKGINNNQPYVALNNRPHYLTFNQYFIRTKAFEFGTNIVIHSKTALTLPTGKFDINGIEYPLYDGTKNTSRLPVHHRLDVAFKWKLGVRKHKNRGVLKLTIANVYNRGNVSSVYLKSDVNNKLEFVRQNYIPLYPYLYYHIRF